MADCIQYQGMADNIHVAIRLRPLLKREQALYVPLWNVINNTIYQVSENAGLASGGVSYTFDRVFDTHEDNLVVYQELCRPIVHSVMEGINGTVFAYGQTASGKTYTMSGCESSPGIIQSSVKDIFSMIENTPDKVFLLRVSYLQIYNDTIADLLNPSCSKSLKINENQNREVVITNLTEVVVHNEHEVIALLAKGEANRHFGETAANARSSRSHAIFRMIIESHSTIHMDDGVHVSHLNMVDLAGSERAGQMGSTGERFKEGVFVNLSLLALGQTIKHLGSKEGQFINYRQSKLTRILQNALGGNARTAIICTITPTSTEQTLSTLKFASEAKRIQNRPIVNEVVNETALLRKYCQEVKRLQQEIERLQRQSGPSTETLSMQLREKDRQNLELECQLKVLRENLVMSSHCLTLNEGHFPGQQRKPCRETWFGQRGTAMFHEDMRMPRPLNLASFPALTDCSFDLTNASLSSEGHYPVSSSTRIPLNLCPLMERNESCVQENKSFTSSTCNGSKVANSYNTRGVQTHDVQQIDQQIQVDFRGLPGLLVQAKISESCEFSCQVDSFEVHLKEITASQTEFLKLSKLVENFSQTDAMQLGEMDLTQEPSRAMCKIIEHSGFEIDKLHERVAVLTEYNTCLQKEYQQLMESTTLEKQLLCNPNASEIKTLENEIKLLNNKLQHLEKVNQALNSRLSSTSESVMNMAALKLKLKDVICENSDLKSQLSTSQEQLTHLKEQLDHLKQPDEVPGNVHQQLTNLQWQCQQYQSMLQEERHKLMTVTKECSALKEERDSLDVNNMRQAKSGPETKSVSTNTVLPWEVTEEPWEAVGLVEGVRIKMLHNKLYHTQKELQKTKEECDRLKQKLKVVESAAKRKKFFDEIRVETSQVNMVDAKPAIGSRACQTDQPIAQRQMIDIENMSPVEGVKVQNMAKMRSGRNVRPLQESNYTVVQPQASTSHFSCLPDVESMAKSTDGKCWHYLSTLSSSSSGEED